VEKNREKWLVLNQTPELGVVGIKRLWDHFGSIEKIWSADEGDFSRVEGLSEKVMRSILENRNKISVNASEVQLGDTKVVNFDDETYPKNLLNIYDPPSILYHRGNLLPQDIKAIAIVGTRRASAYGLNIAKRLASELAGMGITIVSGMALGIDSAAHVGALEASGRTIAVLGCGVDIIYPPSNKKLMQEIINHGAVISEFPPGTEPENWRFPQRNRIISGLSMGVIVIEGHYNSGAMITAKLALDQGREVFAVPGNIEMEQSKGPHWLIKQGAKLVETVTDVLEELNIVVPKKMTNDPSTSLGTSQSPITNEGRDYSNLSYEENKIVAVLSMEPKYIDNIAIESGLSIPQVSSLLLMLEMKNIIRQLPGKMFVLS